jgi:hypothetical protein
LGSVFNFGYYKHKIFIMKKLQIFISSMAMAITLLGAVTVTGQAQDTTTGTSGATSPNMEPADAKADYNGGNGIAETTDADHDGRHHDHDGDRHDGSGQVGLVGLLGLLGLLGLRNKNADRNTNNNRG